MLATKGDKQVRAILMNGRLSQKMEVSNESNILICIYIGQDIYR